MTRWSKSYMSSETTLVSAYSSVSILWHCSRTKSVFGIRNCAKWEGDNSYQVRYGQEDNEDIKPDALISDTERAQQERAVFAVVNVASSLNPGSKEELDETIKNCRSSVCRSCSRHGQLLIFGIRLCRRWIMCNIISDLCWNCGKPGHFSRDSPEYKQVYPALHQKKTASRYKSRP